MSIELAMWSNHLIFYFPFLFLPSTFPSIRVFSNESTLHQVAKYWRFNLSISPSNEYSGLTSFRIDWFDLLAVQRTLKTTGLSSTTNRKHQFFSAQPTLWSIHDYWKNHSIDYVNLCWQTDVSVFSYASRFVITFLPRSKHLLISWLQSPFAVILELKK